MAAVTATIAETAKTTLVKAKKQQEELAAKAKATYLSIVKHPDFKNLTISTTGGAITLGAVGGTFGTACGVVVGSAAGLIPALLTFGLSIPAGAVVGGAGGMCVGSGTGAVVGGSAGFGGYKYRVEIKDGVVFVKKKALTTATNTKDATLKTTKAITDKLAAYKADGQAKVTLLVTKAGEVTTSARTTATTGAKKSYEKAIALAKDPKAQVTTASAAAGGVAGGVTGGTAGLLAGAAVGVVPALFTFGLSIPICATIGLGAGAMGGSAVGAAGGGTAGYVGYTHRKELSNGVQGAIAKTSASVSYVKSKAVSSAGQVTMSVRALVGGSTGGTA
eukprot:TRINITY_DN17110_c0_g1_i1.p2 TRINITY_DN17110_c0_g1~~TRINITY_DN17110_c0_g1_i1.p2  ORF type:complete len:333 (+),score=107.42 TRINITY_DN17110_c0_g1_i1:74-1072(+)